METMNKITLEKLAVYLPYSLKIFNSKSGRIIEMLSCFDNGVLNIHGTGEGQDYDLDVWQAMRPMLRPLSEYADINSPAMKEINANWFVEQEISSYAKHMKKRGAVQYEVIIEMAKAHIDIFNWIPQGLAVNLNTITK